jgi:hypothetical protein
MATTRAPARVAAVLRGTDSAERLDGAVALAERAGVPVTLAIDAETAVGATRGRPELLDRLRAAFATGVLRPLLTTAHRAEAALLSAEELADELRLDEEALQLVLGVTAERRGFDGAGGDVAALEEAGIDFVLGEGDAPCRVGERLVALPAVSLDAAALDAAAARLTALVSRGARVVGADAWAAELTPPWLPEGARATAQPMPPALCALAQLGGWCVDAFGLRRVPGVPAAGLVEEGWRLERFPARARLPLVRRRGLCAERRAWVAAYELCDVLSVEARVPGLAAHATEPLAAGVLPTLRALAEEHGAGEAMARADAAYEELRAFRFLGAQRWRALLTALRDAFALLASRRTVDWPIAAEPAREEETTELHLVDPPPIDVS